MQRNKVSLENISTLKENFSTTLIMTSTLSEEKSDLWIAVQDSCFNMSKSFMYKDINFWRCSLSLNNSKYDKRLFIFAFDIDATVI